MLDQISQRNGLWWPNADHEGWYYTNNIAPYTPLELAKYVKTRGVVVQAGGNCGQYIRQYAELFDTVYTFEPDPLNFLCLTLNCPFTNVFKYQACIGYERNLVDLTVNPFDVGATHINPNRFTGIIPTLKIDDLNLQRCDLIQLDTEGYELHGLMGAEDTISKFRPVLSIEWWEPWAERYGVTLQMLENYIEKWNYVLVGIHVNDRVYVSK